MLKKKISKIKLKIISYIVYFLIKFVGYTSKIINVNEKSIQELTKKNKSIIVAVWHQRLFFIVFALKKLKLSAMTSISSDGEIVYNVLSRLGYRMMRGSTGKKGAVESTLKIIDELIAGRSTGLPVDGPKGPAFKVKEGVIYLAKKSGKPIVPISCSVKMKIKINSWDKFILPLPFNKAVMVYGRAIFVDENDDLNLKIKELESELNQITNLADEMIGEG